MTSWKSTTSKNIEQEILSNVCTGARLADASRMRMRGQGASIQGVPIQHLSAQKPLTLDIQVLEGVSSDCSFLITLCQSFLQDAPGRIASLTVAVEAEDSVAVRNKAHALKSLSTCVGALHLFKICGEMEAAGKGSRMALAAELLKQVNVEYGKVQRALQDYQQSLSVTL